MNRRRGWYCILYLLAPRAARTQGALTVLHVWVCADLRNKMYVTVTRIEISTYYDTLMI